MKVYCSFFKLLQCSSSGLCIRITPGAYKTQLAALSSPTFKFMKLRFMFLAGSQVLQNPRWEPLSFQNPWIYYGKRPGRR